MPDDELLNLATADKLPRPQVLAAQVHRMLADPKSLHPVDELRLPVAAVSTGSAEIQPRPESLPNVAEDRDSDGDIRA